MSFVISHIQLGFEFEIESSVSGRNTQTMSLNVSYIPDGLSNIIAPPIKGATTMVIKVTLTSHVSYSGQPSCYQYPQTWHVLA